MPDQRPGIARRRGSEHQSRDVGALADVLADRFDRFALADDDRGFDPGLVEDLADGRADDAFDAQALLFLEGFLDSAPLEEILRLDHCQHFDPAFGFGGAASGEAKRDARLGAVVDNDQIGPQNVVRPHELPSAASKRGRAQAGRSLFGRLLDPNRRVRFVPSRPAARGKTPMPTELKMPALSPTMEEGTLAKWLVKEGDTVSSGDILAEIETDKATMEFEAVDEGTIAKILVPEGSDGVKVGNPIALLAGEGDEVGVGTGKKRYH